MKIARIFKIINDISNKKLEVSPEELRAFRAKHGLTEDTLAFMLGVKPRIVTYWEAVEPNPDNIRRCRKSSALLFRLIVELLKH